MMKRIGCFMKYTNFPRSVIYASYNNNNNNNTRGWEAQNLLHQYVVLLETSLCEKMQQKKQVEIFEGSVLFQSLVSLWSYS